MKISRRAFMELCSAGVGAAVVSSGLSACTGGGNGLFEHGVASGDPLTDRVILWTRVSPRRQGAEVTVMWEVATDEGFQDVVVMGEATTDRDRDFTMKVDATDLEPGTTYWYRFTSGDEVSPVGRTKTLPEASPESVKLAVFSCSNFPAGYFHVYAEAARMDDVDAAVHLGDYIYEYDREGYASENAEMLDRLSEPDSELLTLEDYRLRYAQYRTDPDLQALHAAMPMIAVWDDHEVTNDTWAEGAENHQPGEGDFVERRMMALQAYAEWLPIRPAVDDDLASIQRNFRFGDLVNLIMLDTRLVARDQQLNFADYVDSLDLVQDAALTAAINDPERTLLGADQRDWLIGQLNEDPATWQVLGQQVLMGNMVLPAAVLPRDLSDPSSAPLTFDELVLMSTLSALQPRYLAGDPTLTAEEIALWEENADFFAANAVQALQPNVPYNLDAWDGYGHDRTQVLEAAVANGVNLVVLAGDTHNAWANDLRLADDTPAGVEFATPSVSSPGLEAFLGLTSSDDPGAAAAAFEGGLLGLVPDLRYSNLLDRGFLTVTFTPSEVTAEWTFVDDITRRNYSLLDARSQTITVAAGANAIPT